MSAQEMAGALQNRHDFSKRDIAIIHYPPPVYALNSRLELAARMPGQGFRAKLLYIHIPFCESFCPFCPYPKAPLGGGEEVDAYLDALEREACFYLGQDGRGKPIAVHFGGGTPSALRNEELEKLLKWLNKRFDLSAAKEITLEANPRSLTAEKADILAKYGVNRVSLGTQTFDDKLGALIGLQQNAAHTEDAIRFCRGAGIKTVNLDLMYNLPGQKPEQFEKDLRRAVEAGADGVSLFPLKLIPGLPLLQKVRQRMVPAKGDLEFEKDLYNRACAQLSAAGMAVESTYDFAYNGKSHLYRKVHFAQRQWDVLALGTAAVGEINGTVYRNLRSTEGYVESFREGTSPILYVSPRTDRDLERRYLVAGFWSLEVQREPFRKQFGANPEDRYPRLFERLAGQKLIELRDDSWRYTQEGLFWGNNICRAFCAEGYREEPL